MIWGEFRIPFTRSVQLTGKLASKFTVVCEWKTKHSNASNFTYVKRCKRSYWHIFTLTCWLEWVYVTEILTRFQDTKSEKPVAHTTYKISHICEEILDISLLSRLYLYIKSNMDWNIENLLNQCRISFKCFSTVFHIVSKMGLQLLEWHFIFGFCEMIYVGLQKNIPSDL